MQELVKIIIDSQEIEVPVGYTIMQACDYIEREIPRFCYHERLSIAGNCRICLVEVEKMPKPVASCTQPVSPGMVIHTNSLNVKKAREGVMEFLLINHPLDCPICDQAGECDLQDQAMAYGKSYSRFDEHKRSVKDKYMGPLIKTYMNRCIHCTRCIRFIEEIAGTNDLGAIGRGENMEITTYIEGSIKSELSGNIIDLCPVGALTSRPYAFKARPWEIDKTESIDILDALCPSIRLDSKSGEVLRVLPIRNDLVNEEWISDKTRFSYDGLMVQRLDTPMLRPDKNTPLQEASYEEVIAAIVKRLNQNVGAIAGDLTDIETMIAMKSLLDQLPNSRYDCRQEGAFFTSPDLNSYIFNTELSNIMQADLCLIIGSNIRCESPLLNARLRRAVIENKMNVALLGKKFDLSYDYQHLTDNPWILKQIADGTHQYSKILKNAKRPMIIVGAGIAARPDFEAFLYYLKKICKQYKIIREDWNGFNFLQNAASRVGGLAINFITENPSQIIEKSTVLFLLGADEIDTSQIPQNTFVVYIGHHGESGASRADAILPAPAYTEKSSTYINIEGRVQKTQIAIPPIGESKPDWEIINDIAALLKLDVPYKSIREMRLKIFKDLQIKDYNDIVYRSPMDLKDSRSQNFCDDKLETQVDNFYMTNIISRHSKIMAQCAKEILGGKVSHVNS